MNIPPDTLLPVALAFGLFAGILAVSANAQEPTDAVARALLAKLDAGRLDAAKNKLHSLRIEGNYAITFEGAATAEPVAKGPFTELYLGEDLARHTSNMGEFGVMEKGVHQDKVWEVDPSMGAKVHAGKDAAVMRRYFALMQGRALSPLYKQVAQTGSEPIDGREHAVLRLTPAEGAPDVAWIDQDGVLARMHMALPVPESADPGYAIDDAMLAKITLGDWKLIDGVRYPHRRTLQMGPATVTSTCTRIEVGAKVAPAQFVPPDAVTKMKPSSAQPAFDKDGKPVYQVIERAAQATATIRLKCKPAEISAQLGIMLPEVMTHIMATGGKMAGAPFSRYHAFSDTEIDLEAGIPVQKPIAEKGRIKNSELPAGKTVTCWHIGAYEKLSGAHEGLRAWLAANNLKSRGGAWEVYWTDPGMVPDQSKWRTQLFQPIE